MEEVKKLISDTSFIFSDYIATAVLSFFYWVVAGKLLFPEQYGIVATTVNFINFLSTFSMFGLGYVVWKLIPEYLERKQKNKIGSLIRFSLKVIFLLLLLIGTLLLFFSQVVTSSLKFSFEVLLIVIASMVALTISSFFSHILLGFQDPKKLFITDAIGHVLKLIISLLLIFLNFSYFGPLLGFLTCFLTIAVIRIIPLTGGTNIPLNTGADIDKKMIIFKYAIPALISTIALNAFINGQYLILTFIKNPEITGFFAVAMLLTSQIYVIPTILTQALFPITSRLSVSISKQKRQNYMINLVFRYILFVSLPMAMLMILFSKPIVLIFSSEKYLPATELFPILAIASLIYACGNLLLTSLYASGKPEINRNIVIVTTLAFLLFSIPLTYLFSSLGLAMAYMVAVSILTSLSYIFIRKYLHIALPKKAILKLLIAIMISFGFFYVAASFTTGLLIGLLWAGISMGIYLLSLLLLGFYVKDDITIVKMFAERAPLFKKQVHTILDFISKHTQNTIS